MAFNHRFEKCFVAWVEKDVAYVLIIWRTSENETNTEKITPSESLDYVKTIVICFGVCVLQNIYTHSHTGT